MRLVFGLLFLAGLGLAGFAVKSAQDRFSAYQNAISATQKKIIETQPVVVVRRQLRYGDELVPEDLEEIAWPVDYVPAGAFGGIDEVYPDGVEGTRTVLRIMERHEPLLRLKVTEPGEEAGLAATLTKGMRAFTLSVDVNSGVAGFLRPGDRVDVYWTGSGDDGNGITKLIHANLPLIAIDQISDEDNRNPTIARNITIEAPSAVVAKLAQAQATGRLSMALVGVRDDTEAGQVTATMREVLGAPERAEDQPAPQTCSVRTRRGAEVVEVPIPCPQSG
jgi:pilus assembly protein CpaB